MAQYYINKLVDLSFDDAIARLKDELKKGGLGSDRDRHAGNHES